MNRVDVLFFLENGPSSEYSYSYFSCLLNGERLEVKAMVKMPAFDRCGRGDVDGMELGRNAVAMSFGCPLATFPVCLSDDKTAC